MINQSVDWIRQAHPCVAVACILAIGFITAALPADEANSKPSERDGQTANSNALLKEYKGKVIVTASSFWVGWGPEKAIDANANTSWFTARGDAAAKGTNPWLQVELPADEKVRRVTILGNHEPSWPNGFSILEGVIEFLDKDGKRIWADEQEAKDAKRDFDFRPEEPIRNVRYIRFTSTRDEGDQTIYEDIALGEIQIE